MTIKLNYDVSGVKKQKVRFCRVNYNTVIKTPFRVGYLSQKSLMAFCKLSSLSAVISIAVSSA